MSTVTLKLGLKEETIKQGFNVWAMLFGPFYAFYKGAWKLGIFILIGALLVAGLFEGFAIGLGLNATNADLLSKAAGLAYCIFVGAKWHKWYYGYLVNKGWVPVDKVERLSVS